MNSKLRDRVAEKSREVRLPYFSQDEIKAGDIEDLQRILSSYKQIRRHIRWQRRSIRKVLKAKIATRATVRGCIFCSTPTPTDQKCPVCWPSASMEVSNE